MRRNCDCTFERLHFRKYILSLSTLHNYWELNMVPHDGMKVCEYDKQNHSTRYNPRADVSPSEFIRVIINTAFNGVLHIRRT